MSERESTGTFVPGACGLGFLAEWKSWSFWDTDGLIAKVQLVL